MPEGDTIWRTAALHGAAGKTICLRSALAAVAPRATSARPASAEGYFPRSAATVPSTPAGGCSSAKRSSSCSSFRRRASVAFSSAVIASWPGWP